MRKIKYIILLMLLFSAASLYADLKLYIVPKVNKREFLRIGDIARIDTMPAYKDEAIRLSKIVINSNLYDDGFVDRKEIADILKKHTDHLYFIYGSASRILENRPEERSPRDIEKKGIFLIKKGDPIKLILIKKGIRIEVHGTAASDGERGRIIPVIINGNKRINGKVTDKKSVEIDL